jgi:hypothetical protein
LSSPLVFGELGYGKTQPVTKRSSDWHITGWAAIFLAPIAIPVGLVLSILGIGKYVKRTPAEVAGFIRDFLESRGGEWDWDDFTSVPLDDPELESIRREADAVDLPLSEHAGRH